MRTPVALPPPRTGKGAGHAGFRLSGEHRSLQRATDDRNGREEDRDASQIAGRRTGQASRLGCETPKAKRGRVRPPQLVASFNFTSGQREANLDTRLRVLSVFEGSCPKLNFSVS